MAIKDASVDCESSQLLSLGGLAIACVPTNSTNAIAVSRFYNELLGQ